MQGPIELKKTPTWMDQCSLLALSYFQIHWITNFMSFAALFPLFAWINLELGNQIAFLHVFDSTLITWLFKWINNVCCNTPGCSWHVEAELLCAGTMTVWRSFISQAVPRGREGDSLVFVYSFTVFHQWHLHLLLGFRLSRTYSWI